MVAALLSLICNVRGAHFFGAANDLAAGMLLRRSFVEMHMVWTWRRLVVSCKRVHSYLAFNLYIMGLLRLVSAH